MKLKALSHYDGDTDTRFGDCILIYDNTSLIVYDCGHTKHVEAVEWFLRSNLAITQIHIVVSHNDDDPTGGVYGLLEWLSVQGKYTVSVYSHRYLRHVDTILNKIDDATQHHPNEEVLDLYKEYTSEEQVYTTHDKGHLYGFIDENGYFTVVPSRFKNSRTASGSMGFKIECKYLKNGQYIYVENNSKVHVGVELIFSIDSWGGIIEPFNDLTAYWEVSNGGIEKDFEHQEIYYKDKLEKDGKLNFRRELLFKGTHLLRCKIKNKTKGQVT